MNLKEGLQFIDKVDDLSAMPNIALDVMAMLNDPRSAVKDIVGKLQLDQAMVSYVLKTCNSALYAVRTEITSIARAVNLLGFATLKSVLMAYFMRNLYRLSGKNQIKESLWKHSISVAVFSKHLAQRKSKIDPEEAYLAGLLHDIGKIVLYLDDAEKYRQVIEWVGTHQDDFFAVEKRLLKYSHVDIGYFLLEKWKFSPLLKEVVLYHHDPDSYSGKDDILGMVVFANQLSHVYLEERSADLAPFLQWFRLSEKELEALVRESTAAVEAFYSLL